MSNPQENPLDWMKSFGATELKKKAAKDAEIVKASTEVKALEGSFNLRGINLGKFRRTGASDKAPDNYRILLVNVEEFIREQKTADSDSKATDVTILSKTKFSVKAYQSVKIAEAMSKIGGEGVADPLEDEEIEALIKAAEAHGRKNVRAHRTDVVIEAFSCIIISCFNKAQIPSGAVVEIMGIEANSFFSDSKGKLPGKWLVSLNAQSIIKSFEDQGSPKANCDYFGVTEKIRLPVFDPDNKDYETYLVPFETTLVQPDKDKPGHISFLQNSKSEEDYAYDNAAKTKMMKAKYMMYRREWDEKGFNKGRDVMVVSTLIQWQKEDKGSNAVIEKFGFPNIADWQKYMSTNPIPILAVCTVDQAETAKLPANPPTLVMNTWEYWPQLQEYLLTMCPKVDAKYVLGKIGSKKQQGYIERDNPNRRNLLNDYNMDKQGDDNIMTGPVVALNSFTGWMQDFIDANCEFRAMMDVNLDIAERIKFRDMSIEDCIKVLNCADDAPIKLDSSPSCYYWAVKPMEDTTPRAMEIDEEDLLAKNHKNMNAVMSADPDDDDDQEEENQEEEEEQPKRKRDAQKEEEEEENQEEEEDQEEEEEKKPLPKKKKKKEEKESSKKKGEKKKLNISKK